MLSRDSGFFFLFFVGVLCLSIGLWPGRCVCESSDSSFSHMSYHGMYSVACAFLSFPKKSQTYLKLIRSCTVRFETASRYQPTSNGSFSAVPKPIFAILKKFSVCSICQDLQSFRAFCNAPNSKSSQNQKHFDKMLTKFADCC